MINLKGKQQCVRGVTWTLFDFRRTSSLSRQRVEMPVETMQALLCQMDLPLQIIVMTFFELHHWSSKAEALTRLEGNACLTSDLVFFFHATLQGESQQMGGAENK